MSKHGRIKKLTNFNKKTAPINNSIAIRIKKRIVFIIKKFNQRKWITGGISIFSFLFVVTCYWFIIQSVPTSFTAKLTQVGDIELSYIDRQSEKISPLCGCYDIVEWERWRGITFASRYLGIERKGDLPATGYLLFSPSPSPVTTIPEFFKMEITYYLIELSEDENFNPESLLNNKLPKSYTLVKKENSFEHFVEIFSDSKLNVALLGDKPLGAWIPMANSIVSIQYPLKNDISEPTIAILKEKYLKSTEEELNQVFDENGKCDYSKIELPIGDFLGPNVVFWSENEAISIFTNSKVLHTATTNSKKKLIKAIVIDPPFTVRLVAIPFGKDAIFEKPEKPPFGKRDDYAIRNSQGKFDNGEINVAISLPDIQAKEYEKIYQSIKQQGTIISDFISDEIGGKMDFRYPPIPPNNGFNIFGKISKLKIGSTLGNLLIGSRSFNLEAPATLELVKINNLEVRNGIMEIPVQIGIADIASKIQLKATSEIFINDEPITRRIDNNKTLVDYAVLIASMLGFILTVVTAIISFKDFKKT